VRVGRRFEHDLTQLDVCDLTPPHGSTVNESPRAPMVGGRRMIAGKQRRHTPEQIVRRLREADRMLGEGGPAELFADTWRCPRTRTTAGGTSSVG
jgi:hypothetical protein